MDLRDLARKMPKYAEAISLDVSQLQTDIALSVVAAISQDTPVDTGKARSNWQLTLDAPAADTRAAFSPFPSRWRTHGVGGTKGETRNQAGVVWSANAVLKGRKPESTVYITNNLPYIDPLNEGHSPQSSAGFVQRAMIRGESTAVARFKFANIQKVSG